MKTLPKITSKDLDWKLIALLGLLLFITWADDITVIGELFDPVELIIDALVAYVIGKRTYENAFARESATVVEGKVVGQVEDEPLESAVRAADAKTK